MLHHKICVYILEHCLIDKFLMLRNRPETVREAAISCHSYDVAFKKNKLIFQVTNILQ